MTEIIFLGTGTATPTERRVCSGLAVKMEQDLLHFDTGAGTLFRLACCGLRSGDITGIFYTHTHPDHVCDLAPILFSLHNTDLPDRTAPLQIRVPPGTYRFFREMLAPHGDFMIPRDLDVEIIEIAGGNITGERWTMTTFPMLHKDESTGYRLTDVDGRILAVSGDTGPCPSLAELARDADLAVFECSFPDSEAVEGHLTPRLAAEAASEAGAAALALTHFYPACEKIDIRAEVKKYYAGNLIIPDDCTRVKLGADAKIL